jgi:poly(A) polymerase
MSRSERERLTALAADPPLVAPDDRAVRALVYREGKLRIADRLIMAAAEGRSEGLAEHLALVRDWPVPALPVRGRDAAGLGLAGPAIGEALRAVEAWWVAEDFSPGRLACLARLAEIADRSPNRFDRP